MNSGHLQQAADGQDHTKISSGLSGLLLGEATYGTRRVYSGDNGSCLIEICQQCDGSLGLSLTLKAQDHGLSSALKTMICLWYSEPMAFRVNGIAHFFTSTI